MTKPFRIAIQTNDIRIYHKLLKMLEDSKLKANFFTLDQTIPSEQYDLIISTQKSLGHQTVSKILQIKYEEIKPDLILKIIGIIAISRRALPMFKQLIIGIDPGENIGVAAICDGMILAAEKTKLDHLAIKINNYLESFPSEIVVIRIGDQPPSVSNVIFNKLFTVFGNGHNITLEIVDEAFSNPKETSLPLPVGSDETAAITIARRSGRKKTHPAGNEVPLGRIKEIQKWSRELSGNQFTLDLELARAVAIGEISLERAIAKKEKQLEAKNND